MTEHVTPITEKNAVTIGELMDRVELNLKDRADELARQGRSLRSLGALDDLAARMVAALPSVHPWDTAIGPFYDTAGLMLWLGVTRQALADRERRGTLLACRTARRPPPLPRPPSSAATGRRARESWTPWGPSSGREPTAGRSGRG